MTHVVLRRGRAAAAFFTLFTLAAAGCEKPQPAPPPPEVTVAPAITRDVADWQDFTGHFEAVQSVDVRPRVSGFIQRVAFVEGAVVRQGDVLFTIDARPYAAAGDRAEALLEQARTREALARQELTRAQTLVSTQAISREELDARASEVASSVASVRAAAAAVATARLDLDWTTVRAPITGRVGRADITAGNLVQSGPPSPSVLTTIVSLDPIYVYFDTDEAAYLKYNASADGRSVQLGLAGETGFPHAARLDFVDNRVDPSTGTVRVRAVLPNPNHLFAPGLFARVRLAGGKAAAATLVQDQAVGTDQDRRFVLVLKPDNTVDYRPVTLGRLVDGLRVVERGLAPGDRVVINGLLRVRPGMKVSPKTADMLALAK